jgi:hypothetical protein
MGLIRGALHIASYGAVSPKSKKQRTAAMQLAAMQGASEAEIKIAGSRNFDFVNQDKIRRLQEREQRRQVEAEPSVLTGSCPKCSRPVVWYTETNQTPVHTATGKFECPPDEASRGAVTAELERLAALHQSGALDDDEFRAAKRQLLG